MDIEATEGKIVETCNRIARLLAQDAGYFFRQTVRGQFAEHPEVADGLSDEALTTLKSTTYEAAKAASERVAEALSPKAVWLDAEPAADLKRPVSVIPEVSKLIEEIEAQLAGFLAEQRLTPAAQISWRLPARFIDGDHLPTLTETYWKQMIRRAELVAEARAKAERQSNADRLRRWDQA